MSRVIITSMLVINVNSGIVSVLEQIKFSWQSRSFFLKSVWKYLLRQKREKLRAASSGLNSPVATNSSQGQYKAGESPFLVGSKEICRKTTPAQPDRILLGPHLFVPAVVSLCRLAENNSNDFHFIATSISGSQKPA